MIVAEVSVGKMLLAGVVPGLMLAAVLMIFIYWLARTGRVECPTTEKPTGTEFRRALLDGIPALFAPFIILMGIVGGVVTPTEAGVAACVYSFLVSLLIYREMSLAKMRDILVKATLSSAHVMLIIGVATVMSWIITREQSAMQIAQWMTSLTDQVWVQLLLLNAFLLIVGALIEARSPTSRKKGGNMKKIILSIIALTFIVSLAGCNTIKGFGEDVKTIGGWITAGSEPPIDASGSLPDGTSFEGPAELREVLLSRHRELVATLTGKLLTYAMGRGVEHYDQPAIREILRKAEPDDYRWSSIILGIVESTPFRMRKSKS